jgi:hypothetical protein
MSSTAIDNWALEIINEEVLKKIEPEWPMRICPVCMFSEYEVDFERVDDSELFCHHCQTRSEELDFLDGRFHGQLQGKREVT